MQKHDICALDSMTVDIERTEWYSLIYDYERSNQALNPHPCLLLHLQQPIKRVQVSNPAYSWVIGNLELQMPFEQFPQPAYTSIT